MPNKYRNVLCVALYALMVLIAFFLQTVVLSGHSFFGGKLSLLPVAAVCAALFLGAEQGSLFCLVTGVLYALTGADMGVVTLVVITFCGALAGGACQVLFKKHLLPCALFSALALVLSEGGIFLLKLYFGQTQRALFFSTLLPGLALSLACVLVFFPASWLIAQIGGEGIG